MNQFDDTSVTKMLPEVQTIDIEFHDISYTVNNSGGEKQLLRGVSGSFRSGEVTAVLGPSGAGKTTLLNILAGYNISSKGISGTVLVNNNLRHPLRFRRLCCYIMQDALVQQHLSVKEVMMIASNLKVGGLAYEDRLKDIMSILNTLGIDKCVDTRTEVLSGGQKKRLTIALELVNNPSVLFLDEPTTGLDTHAGKMVMGALLSLASQGRTIVCTIHQPCPLEFRAYHNTYVIARGSCVYAGSPSRLVPFLQEAGTPCPTTYSPADYIIELIQMKSEIIDHLASSVINEQMQNKENFASENLNGRPKLKLIKSSSTWTKLSVLFRRMMLQKWRNVVALRLQLIHHLFSAILVGLTFYGIGNDASAVLSNIKFAMCLCVFYTYTYCLTAVLHFPLEIELIKREYFNNWYGPLPYFISYSLSNIPLMIPNVILFTFTSFYVTDQPLEWNRILYLIIVACVTSYCAEGIGLFIGSLGNIKAGCTLGPTVIGTIFALSIYGLGFGQTVEPYMNIFMKFTFLRYSLAAIWLSIFGLNRANMNCNEIYCHWKESVTVIKDIGIQEFTPEIALAGLIAYSVLYRILGYLALRIRLHTDLPGSTTNFIVSDVAEKVINHFRRKKTMT